ncbi:hypothetical protein SteCoe_18519 [Stentor coeruleus]|uniref:Receptor ligand binding region domain-containing protein n=1 Tax=Stentor coeruleus TaxID=5963 RepID=A0A1R2BWJ5_9CILI|nr:hypothetical protein SteCoe_18519 [Stentor coeruleus]
MAILSFWLQLLTVYGISIEDGIILISTKTPYEMRSQFSNAGLILDITLKSFDEIYTSLANEDYLFIVDVTWDKSYLGILNSLSMSLGIVYLTSSSEMTKFPFRVPLLNMETEEAQSLLAFIKYLKIENFVILSSSIQRDQTVSDLLTRETLKNSYSHITYSDELTQSVAENIIGSMIKAKGIKNVVIIDSSDSLQIIEKAIQSKKYIKLGTIVIYSSTSFYHEHIDGTLSIKEYMSENAENKYKLFLHVLINKLTKAENYIEKILKCKVNKENLLLAFSIFYTNETLYTITNVQNGKDVPIGKIIKSQINKEDTNFQVNITDTIYYPGNITEITSMKAKIVISIANGTNDPYNTFSYQGFAYMYLGANYAVFRSNFYNEIPNFYIELFPTDCGMFWYEPLWYKNCYEPILDSMGIAILTSFYGDAIKGNIFTLRTLSKVIPQISPLGIDSTLDNKNLYPELVKLESTLKNFISSRIITIMSLGYTDIIYIASNDSEYLKERSELFRTIIHSSGMKIINDENHMHIQSNYTREDFDKYIEFFYYIKNTRCTVFFLAVYYNEMVIEALYDVGLRKGDFFFMLAANVVEFLDGIEEPYATKRRELIEGSLVMSYKEYVGDLGQEIQKELSEKYEDISFMCMTYDTVSVVKEAIKYLLSIGDDYENYNKLMNAIRKNKFVGCLGNVYFDKEENTRASSQFIIKQIIYNSTTKLFDTIDISYLDRFSSQMFTFINPYVWPIGSSPPNYRLYNPCPFNIYNIQSSSKGKTALYIFLSFFIILSLVVCILTYFKSEKKIIPLTDKKYISFEDYFFFLYFPLQFFQIIAMGPDQDAYVYFINNFQAFFSLDFNIYLDLKFEKFWFMFYWVLTFTVFWIFGCFLYWSRLGRVIEKTWWTSFFAEINKIVIIIGGNIGFIPIISMLMNIYICINSIGENITDSYLKYDCTTMCYKDTHKSMIILTTIVLIFYISLAIYFRSLWENEQESLNVKTKTSYLLILSFSQIVLVVLNKTLKNYSQNIHGVVCCIIITGMIIITIVFKPYNYIRATISQCITFVSAFFIVLNAIVLRNTTTIINWLIINSIIIVFVLIAGIIIMKKFPEKLFSEKRVDISSLFIFQFCNNYHKYLKDSKCLKINAIVDKYKVIELSRNSEGE